MSKLSALLSRRKSPSRHRSRGQDYSRRLRFERLEDRSMLSGSPIDLWISAPGMREGMDLDFAVEGQTLTGIQGADNVYPLAARQVAPDQLLVASAIDNGIMLVRYAYDGSLDDSFSDSGQLFIDFGGFGDGNFEVHDILFQPDGRIVVAAGSFNGNDYDFAVLRFNEDGTIDETFSDDGVAEVNLSSPYDDIATSIALQADGSIVAAGWAQTGTRAGSIVLAMARFTADGELDESFSNVGFFRDTESNSAGFQGTDVLVLADGRLAVATFSIDEQSSLSTGWVGRLDATGEFDASFGDNGRTVIPLHGDDFIRMTQQADGRLVAVSSIYNDADDSRLLGVVRLDTSGALDAGFGSGGLVTSQEFGAANDVVVQPDGKIVVVAHSYLNGEWDDGGLLRFLSDGSPDATFGTDGVQILHHVVNSDPGPGLMLQTDGKIIAFSNGYYDENLVPQISVSRFGGSYEVSFGNQVHLESHFVDSSGGTSYTYAWQVSEMPVGPVVAEGTGSTLDFEPTSVGQFIVELTVTNDLGEMTQSNVYVNVSLPTENVAPQHVQLALTDSTINEGGSATLSGSFVDWNLTDTHHVFIAWGGGATTELDLAAGVTAFSGLSHTYLDNPASGSTYTITATVTDQDAAAGVGMSLVTVNNSAPTGTLGNAGPVAEGSPVAVSFSTAQDASSVDQASLRYFFSTNAAARNAATYATSAAVNSQNFTFADDGNFVVYARVIDKDGGFTDYQTTVTVNNVAPTISLGGNASVDYGVAYTLNLGEVVDPGADTVTSFTINWGDGSSNTFGASPAGLSKTHIYSNGAPGGTSYAISVSLTDGDGIFSSAGNKTVTVFGPTVKSWGANGYGQLGIGTNTSQAFPISVLGLTNVISIAEGASHGLALKSDGTVWAWGYNYFGQLGDGSTTNRTTPVQVSGLNNIVAIAAGYNHSLAVKSDGSVVAWGRNTYGQLGDGTTTNRSTPVTVSGLSGVTAIAAGEVHSLALRSDGTVRAWGYNGNGLLGDGSTTTRLTPVAVSGLTGVTAIAAGVYHSLALRSDGTVRAWGGNPYSQLGDGSTTTRLTPVAVSGLTGVTAIAAGAFHSLALRSDGTVRAWGYNSEGQLGDGTTTQRATPVTVSGLTSVTAIAAGSYHSLALKSDGTARAWGANGSGQLGDGSTTNRPTPVTVNGLTGVASISAGFYSSHARLGLQPGWVGSGKAVNGYLVGATAFVDANFNGELDPDEPWTITDGTGAFEIVISSTFDTNGNGALDDDEGQWVVYGGVDSSTGEAAVNKLIAPGSWSVVTPLTTLVSTLAANYGLDLEEAASRVEAALGLPALDLSTLDPIAATVAGDPNAAAIFAAHAQVQDTIAQALALFAGAASAPAGDDLTGILMNTLASLVVQPGSTVNLSDAAVIGVVLRDTQVSSGVALDETVISGAATVIAAGNQLIAEVPVTSDVTYLTQVAEIKSVARGAVAEQLAQAAQGTANIEDVVAANTGAALETQVAAAAIPPTLIVPTVVYVEATSAGGAVAEFQVSATNLAGDAVAVTTTPESGSFFAFGSTTVTATATEGSATATATFTVIVQDTLGPELTLPPSIVVTATDPAGAIVSFAAPTAVDLVDPAPSVIADATPGLFAVGTTIVNVTATDASGNVTEGFFTITVLASTNEEPTITSLTNSASDAGAPAATGSVTLQSAFADADVADMHHATIEWGDGSQTVLTENDEAIDQSLRTLSTSHIYTAGGIYTISLTVFDNDGGFVTQATTAYVSGASLRGGVLQIVGTAGNDEVNVARQGADKLKVQAGFVPTSQRTFNLADVTQIVILLGDGNDDAKIGSGITLAATLDGGDGDDTLDGGNGPNLILGGAGNDKLKGGSGNDTIIDLFGDNEVRTSGGANTITTGSGNDRIWADGGNDIIDAGDGSNEIHAGKGNNVITAGSGNDRIWANGGDDIIQAGDGNNEIHAGRGRNYVYAGAGHDQIWTNGDDDFINAGDGNNTIRAGNGNNTVIAGAGNDRIWTGNGNDNIQAGDGDNEIHAGAGNDVIITGSGCDDIEAGAGNDYVSAGGGNDTVNGGAGDDILLGDDGDDTLTGGQGADILIGGLGADDLEGGDNDDILIGSRVTLLQTELETVRSLWTSSASYDARRASVAALLVPLSVVLDDDAKDTIRGNKGRDLYFAKLGSATKDDLKDKANDEYVYGL